jgi:dienelactone hydrolase
MDTSDSEQYTYIDSAIGGGDRGIVARRTVRRFTAILESHFARDQEASFGLAWQHGGSMQKSAAIEYNHDAYLCEGFAVWDDAGAKRPGILIFPEWGGVGEYAQKRAQMLGNLGFNAFVVDVYGKGIRPNTPETCQAEMMKYATERPLLRERARCGFDELRKVPNTDLGKLAAIGYCFGGMAVLEMARDGQNDLAGVVSFHGVLATPMRLKRDGYQGKILVLHGADDPIVPDDQTIAFWNEMRDANANWEFVAYGKAFHTFTNWLMPEDGPPPQAYNKQADRRSWVAMQKFSKEIFA